LLFELLGPLFWRVIRIDTRKSPSHATGHYDHVPRQALRLVKTHYLNDVTVTPRQLRLCYCLAQFSQEPFVVSCQKREGPRDRSNVTDVQITLRPERLNKGESGQWR
jgi:hypothetical protein